MAHATILTLRRNPPTLEDLQNSLKIRAQSQEKIHGDLHGKRGLTLSGISESAATSPDLIVDSMGFPFCKQT